MNPGISPSPPGIHHPSPPSPIVAGMDITGFPSNLNPEANIFAPSMTGMEGWIAGMPLPSRFPQPNTSNEQKICRDFNKKGRCTFGKNCKYSHVKVFYCQKEEPSMPCTDNKCTLHHFIPKINIPKRINKRINNNPNPNVQYCYDFNKNNGRCNYPNCRFKHELIRSCRAEEQGICPRFNTCRMYHFKS